MDKITIRAKFVFALYNKDNYCIYKYRDIDANKQVTCVGENLPCNKKLKYEFTCTEETTKKYGKQYRVLSYTEIVERTEDDIIEYLTSGIFKGIGKKTAQSIYNKFGIKTMDILADSPEKLAEVKGISKKKADKIIESYKDSRVQAELFDYLAPVGVSLHQVQKIVKWYPCSTMETIKQNPYVLCNIHGITFSMADAVAEKEGFEKDCYLRVNAATREVLKTNYLSGDVRMNTKDFATAFVKLCNCREITGSNWFNYIYGPLQINEKTGKYEKIRTIVPPKGVNPYAGPIQSGLIKRVNNGVTDVIYSHAAYMAEKELTCAVARLMMGSTEKYDIEKIEKYSSLDPSQQEAIKTALSKAFSIITGGPGTGKTTIIKILADEWQKKHKGQEVILLSPTGKAARRMAESCGRPASTIHSFLKLDVGDDADAEAGSGVEIKDALVVVDEVSMLDLWLARTLLMSIRDSKVVFVGDSDQLPSVGAGKVLQDMIESNVIPVSKLIYTHRQDEGSTICDNAEKIRQGVPSLTKADDFNIIEIATNDIEESRTITEELMTSAYREELEKYGEGNVICLCPFKKYTAGTRSLNKHIQSAKNPKNEHTLELYGRNGDIFRVGDPVIQLRNVLTEGGRLSNGDVGKVTSIIVNEDAESEMTVLFENGTQTTYRKADTEDIALAYAITIHKSQGSEYDSVIICVLDSHYIMLYRKLIYTAITRGAKKVTLIGHKTAMQKAICDTNDKTRNTGLKDMLIDTLKATSGIRLEANAG